VVLYLGIFPSSALELARTSVEGLTTVGGVAAELTQ
jgi:hypothetical protein